ncbi:hypothetical protein [Mucisphaera sp.]|uniref:hypothetical protein n=1 Tax=Mucisphaera sp. TaxID=2913024 RepID=UPI003D0DEEBC
MTSPVIEQLRQLRQRATRLAILLRLSQALAITTATLLGLGLLDFILRFPAWLRTLVLIALLALAIRWIIERAAATNWRESLVDFALRIERLQPHWRGRLATAIELSQAKTDTTAEHHELAASLSQAAQQALNNPAENTPLTHLLNLKPLTRWAQATAAALITLFILFIVTPAFTQAGLARWLIPWAAGPWPTLTQLTLINTETVRPLGVPIHVVVETPATTTDRRILLTAEIIVDDQTFTIPDQLVLTRRPEDNTNPDTARYEAWINPPAELTTRLNQQPADAGKAILHFTSGWDRVPPATLELAPRPRITAATATITPPSYARDLLDTREENLDLTTGPETLTALPGSTLDLTLNLSRPIRTEGGLAGLLPDQQPPADATFNATPHSLTTTFTMPEEPRTLTLQATSTDGLTLSGSARLTLQPNPDRPPTVRLLQPDTDQRVLPSATLTLRAQATDDIALQNLILTYQQETDTDDTPPTTTLAERNGPAPTLELTLDWPLTPLNLTPGSTLLVSAQATDTYNHNSQTHPVQRTVPRRIIVVDEDTFREIVRQDLALIDRRIDRALNEQRRLQAEDLEPATPAQQRLAETLSELADRAATLRSRAQRNQLDDTTLNQLLEQFEQGLEAAANTAQQAAEQFETAESETDPKAQQAREQQSQTAEQLEQLRALLDERAAAMQAVEQARELAQQQQALAQRAAELLPQTLGRNPEDLPQTLQEQLEQLARDQQALAEATAQAADQWRQKAEELAANTDSPAAQAMAQALEQAANTAQQQQLPSNMNQAAQRVAENQLARASAQQQQLAQQLQQLAEQLEQAAQAQPDNPDQLAALINELQAILEEQTEQRTEAQQPATNLASLAEPARNLRLRTLAGLEQVEALDNQEAAAAGLRNAIDSQTEAVRALRLSRRDPAIGNQIAAEESLRSAIIALQQQLDEALAQAMIDRRRELREAYRALAAQQRELREAVTADRNQAPRTTRRITLAAHADTQETIAADADDLAIKVTEAAVFASFHARITELANRTTRQLRAGYAENDLLNTQREIATTLELMADALEDQPPDPNNNQSPSQGGSGQPGQAAEPPLIVDAAQLRLLRAIQQQILDQTRTLQAIPQQDLTVEQRDQLQTLSVRQRDLARTAQQLIQENQ